MARILQVCNSAFYLTKFLAPLVRGLVAGGHEVECACEGTDYDARLLAGIEVHAFPFQRRPSPVGFLRAIGRMRGLIRRGGYDCVASHNRSASIVGRVAAWREGVPVNLYTAHGFYFHDDQGPAAYAATVGLEALLARVTSYTLSQSAADTAMMTRRRLIASSRIETIGNGIDTRRFRPRPGERASLEHALGLVAGRYRVAATGRVVRGKGFGDLLEGFARFHAEHPDAELLIIGGVVRYDIEPYQAEFLERVRSLGLAAAVTMTGIVDRVEDYLACSDLFVLPSYREGMPRALLEAMSMELPVLATDIRGCREIVRDGVDGALFPAHDVGRLHALLIAARRDATASAERGRRAGARARASFDEVDYVARQVAAIGRLLERPTQGRRRGRARGEAARA